MVDYRRTMPARTLIGDKVMNMQGDKLDDVEEIMIDVETGRVSYVVVSHGGLLGVGDKLFAIPWQALTLSEEEHTFYLPIIHNDPVTE